MLVPIGRRAAYLRGQFRDHPQRSSPLLIDLGFNRQPVPSSCHVRQDGLHSRIWRALRHLPTFCSVLLTFNRIHNAPPLAPSWSRPRRPSTIHRLRTQRKPDFDCVWRSCHNHTESYPIFCGSRRHGGLLEDHLTDGAPSNPCYSDFLVFLRHKQRCILPQAAIETEVPNFPFGRNGQRVCRRRGVALSDILFCRLST